VHEFAEEGGRGDIDGVYENAPLIVKNMLKGPDCRLDKVYYHYI
jgi:hypothetical protein